MLRKTFVVLALVFGCSTFALAGARWAQDFYFEVEPIKIKEPMAVVVGSTRPGEEIFEINLTDVGMYMGHICPCVAGAYKLTKLGLEALYESEVPERGNIRVVANSPSAVLDVASYITGARSFYGCEERHRGDLAVDENLEARKGDIAVIFQRKDTGKTVRVVFHKSILCSPEKKSLEKVVKEKIVLGEATEEEAERFWKSEQEEAKRILFNPASGLFEVEELPAYDFPKSDTEAGE